MNKLTNGKYIVSIFIALLFALSNATAWGNEANPVKKDSIVRSSSMYFKFDVSHTIDSLNQQEMDNLVFWVKGNEAARINICGWTDKVGTVEYNKVLSRKRAETAKSYLVGKGVESSRIAYIGMGIDYDSPTHLLARRSTIMAVLDVVEPPKPKPAPPKPEPKPEPEPVVEEPVVEEPVVETPKGKFSIRTNLLYWLGASINAGFEWNPANTSIGVLVNGGYAPLGGDNWKHSNGGWFVSPEIRYYFNETKGWFVGGEFLAGGYNHKLGTTGYQGDVIAGGATGGYKIELSDTFDMDFSLGLGYGTIEYDRYYHHESGINVRTSKDQIRTGIMPIQAGVSLIWKIK